LSKIDHGLGRDGGVTVTIKESVFDQKTDHQGNGIPVNAHNFADIFVMGGFAILALDAVYSDDVDLLCEFDPRGGQSFGG